MKVTGASLDNGLLCVDVVREVPEAAKPRTIKIGAAVETVRPQVTEQKAAQSVRQTATGRKVKTSSKFGGVLSLAAHVRPTYR
jgi:hypothetical protein